MRLLTTASVTSLFLFTASVALAQPAAPPSAEPPPVPTAPPAATVAPPVGTLTAPAPMPPVAQPAPPPVTQPAFDPYAAPAPQPPPPSYGPPFGQQWSPVPPPPPARPEQASVRLSENGFPKSMRGGLSIDASAVGAADEDFAGGTLLLRPSIPMSDMLFLDLRMPFAFANGFAAGNPSAAVRGIVKLSDRTFLAVRGGLGIPLLNEDATPEFYYAGLISSAFWNAGEFSPNTVPLFGGVAIEGHPGDLVVLRGIVDLNILFGYEDNGEHEFTIDHAFEVQLGHRFGGGLRLQGVAMPTYERSEIGGLVRGDLYQLMFEPFFVFEDETFFARAAISLPADGQLGPPIEQSFAVKIASGFHID